ncbi:MAG: hypothetical protein JWP74_1318 [Marmoricola sp.]|nr:hypothetical protein [Marmoricola sp.]
MNTRDLARRVRAIDVLDGVLIALDLTASAYCTWAILVSARSTDDMSGLGILVGIAGLVMFAPAGLLLAAGRWRHATTAPALGLIAVGRTWSALAAVLAVYPGMMAMTGLLFAILF